MRFILLFVGVTIADAINPAVLDLANASEGVQNLFLGIMAYAVVLDIIEITKR